MSTFILPVTTLFVCANTLLLVGLAMLVVHHRIANQVALGGAGIEALERAIRTHANLIEYAPLALILLGLLEVNGLPGWQLLVLGGVFTVARLSHAHGMLTATLPTRSAGALFTIIIMVSMVGRLLTLALFP